MQPFPILQILILLLMANGAPVLAKRIFGERFSRPLDGSLKLRDGQPLFGASKTLRGLLSAVLAASACAPLIGLDWTIGALVAGSSMAGDLVSSFLKRRLRLQSSSRATGLDQIPESLLPFIACRTLLALTWLDIVAGVALFFIGEIALSRLLYRLGVRNRPY
jgi:CDP-2,3-bis-(O-geranylgeranyl)-sn-glycerol synthase